MQSSETEFARIFESGKYLNLLKLSDANIRTDDGCNFDVHSVMLARSSDYFRSMFVGMDERRRKFHIPGISGGCLSDILRYIYTDEIQVTDRNITDLIIGADYLLMEDLQIKIKDNIKANLTEVNCLRILLEAHLLSDEYIFRKCFRFIQTRFEWIMRSHGDELADLPLEILGRILRNRSLYVYNETPVWQAIVAWTQKDITLRMSYVPKLLLSLAMDDIDEQLATEIVQHEIISENCFMKDLVEVTSSNDLTTNLDVLLTFFRSYSNTFKEPILRHRIPLQLVIAWSSSSLYITYDENIDLCRKITTVRRQPDVLIAIGHNIYIFEIRRNICWNFDLRTMQWVRMEKFRNIYCLGYCVLATDAYIYVLGDNGESGERRKHDLEVYDTANNRWSNGVPLRKIWHVSAVAIEKKIYVVGENRSGIIMQMFDQDTQQWSILTPPTKYRYLRYELLAYHQKIYLIGAESVEVFDPATNLWKKLPLMWTVSNIDDYHVNWSTRAIVFNDQIIGQIIGDRNYGRGPYMHWNNTKECWEKFEENVIERLEDIMKYSRNIILTDEDDVKTTKFYIVQDVGTIRMITKQNRDPHTQMKNEILF